MITAKVIVVVFRHSFYLSELNSRFLFLLLVEARSFFNYSWESDSSTRPEPHGTDYWNCFNITNTISTTQPLPVVEKEKAN